MHIQINSALVVMLYSLLSGQRKKGRKVSKTISGSDQQKRSQILCFMCRKYSHNAKAGKRKPIGEIPMGRVCCLGGGGCQSTFAVQKWSFESNATSHLRGDSKLFAEIDMRSLVEEYWKGVKFQEKYHFSENYRKSFLALFNVNLTITDLLDYPKVSGMRE